MVNDKASDILVYSMSPQIWRNRKSWDCYVISSLKLWLDVDSNGTPYAELYDKSLHNQYKLFRGFYVLPSYCIVEGYHSPYSDVLNFNRGVLIRNWIRSNISYWNSVKFNDIRTPETCPPDLSFWGNRWG